MSEPSAPQTPQTISEYLRAFDRALRVPALVRRRILHEVRDHLQAAVEAAVEAGARRAEAERAAVRRFGSVGRIAAEFAEVFAKPRVRGLGPLLWISVAAAAGLALVTSARTLDRPQAPQGQLWSRLSDVGEGPAAPSLAPATARALDDEPAAEAESPADPAPPALAASLRGRRAPGYRRAARVSTAAEGALAAPSGPAETQAEAAPALEEAEAAQVSEPAVPPPARPPREIAPAGTPRSPETPGAPAPPVGRVLASRGLSRPPALVGPDRDFGVRYPPEARWMNVSGDVLVILHVDADGRVTEATVTKHLGYGLDEVALDIAWRLRFRPAVDADGRSAESFVNWGVHFERASRARAVPMWGGGGRGGPGHLPGARHERLTRI